MKKNKKWTVLALICLLMLMLMVLPVKAETNKLSEPWKVSSTTQDAQS